MDWILMIYLMIHLLNPARKLKFGKLNHQEKKTK